MKEFVHIVEVGPRDGLQNEMQIVPMNIKLALIDKLIEAGLNIIEIGAFVSPKWVPQMADTKEIVENVLEKYSQRNLRFPVLVPNQKGLEDAIHAGIQEISLFGAASETFSLKNINVSIKESFARFKDVIHEAKEHKMRIRGYMSCVMGCPYEGVLPLNQVIETTEQLFALGCDEISLGDTIGVGTPNKVKELLQKLSIPKNQLAVHFHDTYGQALANIYVALEEGIRILDASVAGLGGCPYAKGASGNVATEDVLYMLDGLGFETGINSKALFQASLFITEFLKKIPESKVTRAYLTK